MVGRIPKPKEYNLDTMVKYTQKLFGIGRDIAKAKLVVNYDDVQNEFHCANIKASDAAIWLFVRIGLDESYSNNFLKSKKSLCEMERITP